MTMGRGTVAVAVLVGGLLMPQWLPAEESHGTWERKMEDRVRMLEDRLSQSQATIESQQAQLAAYTGPDVAAGGALDGFFEGLEWGGFVQSTYSHNFRNPDTPMASQPLCQFNCNHETFALDAFKLELGKPAREAGDAGFQVDLVWGQNGAILGGFTGTAGQASDNWSHVQEAYVAYNWHGTTIKAGKFETLLGAEVIDAPLNYNITQGVLFTFAIPLVHVGVLASGNLTEEIGWAAGVTNGFNVATDTNDNKGLLGQLSFERNAFFSSISAYYGADGGTGLAPASSVPTFSGSGTNNHDRALILDLVTRFAPDEATALWFNADYGSQENVVFTAAHGGGAGTRNAIWWGVAGGVHHQFSERIDGTLRAELFSDEDGYRLPIAADDAMAYSLTGTLGFKLTQNLKTRAELRWDKVGSDGPAGCSFNCIFPAGRKTGTAPSGRTSATYAIWEVVYEFD